MRALSRVVLARTSRRPSLTPEVVPHAGQTQVCQLDQMKRIDSDVRVRQGRGDRLRSIATTWMRSRQAWLRAPSHPVTAALPRPSTIPRTCPEAALTKAVIHGSTRRHPPVSGSRNQRTRR